MCKRTNIFTIASVLSLFIIGSSANLSAANLIQNPGFEDGWDNWQEHYGSGTKISTHHHNSGDKSAKLVADSHDAGCAQNNITVVPNSKYILKAYIKVLKGEIFIGVNGSGGCLTDISSSDSDWVQVTKSFNTGANNSISVYAWANEDCSGYVDDFELTKDDTFDKPNIVQNPGFEKGWDNWQDHYGDGTTISTDVYNSEKQSAKIGPDPTESGCTQTDIAVTPNTNYTFKAYIKSVKGNIVVGVNNESGKKMFKLKSKSTEWVQVSKTFNTGENSSITVFAWAGPNKTGYVDDFELVKEDTFTEPNRVENPGFENNWDGWQYHFGSGTTISTDVYNSGKKSAKLGPDDSESGCTQTNIAVVPNTKYTFKAYIKSVKGKIYVGVNDQAGKRIFHLKSDSSDWVQVTESFNTGANESVTVYAWTDSKNTGYVDDFELIKEDTFDNPNLVLNPDFQNDWENWQSHYGKGTTISKDEYNSGTKSAKIGPDADESGCTQKNIAVKPNTNYTLKAYVKVEDGKIYVGVNDQSGKRIFHMKSDSSHWTQISETFNTGSNKFISVYAWADKNYSGYVDDFDLREEE